MSKFFLVIGLYCTISSCAPQSLASDSDLYKPNKMQAGSLLDLRKVGVEVLVTDNDYVREEKSKTILISFHCVEVELDGRDIAWALIKSAHSDRQKEDTLAMTLPFSSVNLCNSSKGIEKFILQEFTIYSGYRLVAIIQTDDLGKRPSVIIDVLEEALELKGSLISR